MSPGEPAPSRPRLPCCHSHQSPSRRRKGRCARIHCGSGNGSIMTALHPAGAGRRLPSTTCVREVPEVAAQRPHPPRPASSFTARRMGMLHFVSKSDLKHRPRPLPTRFPKGRCDWCCKNHLLYEKDYFMIPVSHFLKCSKQDVQRCLGGLFFLAFRPQCVLFSAVSSLGTKGIIDVFPATSSS